MKPITELIGLRISWLTVDRASDLMSLSRCAFVAKSDVKRWPVFGWFARLAGTIFVELIFRVPGLGKFFVTSISLRDYPMIMATMLLVATLWSVTYLVSDILYTVVDPRVRLFGPVSQ